MGKPVEVKTGERVRELRERHLLTQPQLAMLIGVTAKTVGSWEAGTHAPKPTHLAALSELFDQPAAVVRGDAPLRPLGEADELRMRRAFRVELERLQAEAEQDGDAHAP